MEEARQRAKQLILDSPVSRMVSLEKIEEVFNNIIVYDSKEEFDEVTMKYSNGKPYGTVSGFVNGNKIYLGPEHNIDKLIHVIVHESLHMFSKKWDEKGNIIQQGMTGHKGQGFADFVNEGITDYLTSKIVGKGYCQYVQEVSIIEGIDEDMQVYFEDEDVLFSMYLEDDNTGLDNKRFKEFLDTTGGNDAYDELYERIGFMGPEKKQEYLKRIHKGTNKFVRKRNFKRTVDKIKGMFVKKDKKQLLNESKTDVEETIVQNTFSLVDTLQGEVKEIYEEFPPKEHSGVEEQQL